MKLNQEEVKKFNDFKQYLNLKILRYLRLIKEKYAADLFEPFPINLSLGGINKLLIRSTCRFDNL